MGLANPLEQPAEQGAGLSSYTAPRPIQSSSETIVSHNKQDFRFVVCSQFYCHVFIEVSADCEWI